MRHHPLTHLLALIVTLLGLAGAAGTPAGTVIENQATFQGVSDDGSGAPFTARSATVQTVVSQVCSLSVLPNGTLIAPGQSVNLLPAETATLHYTLSNTGNAVNTFTLSTTTDRSSAFTPGDLSVHLDANGNGLVDTDEPAVTSIDLPADGSAALLVRASTQNGSRGQAFLNLAASPTAHREAETAKAHRG